MGAWRDKHSRLGDFRVQPASWSHPREQPRRVKPRAACSAIASTDPAYDGSWSRWRRSSHASPSLVPDPCCPGGAARDSSAGSASWLRCTSTGSLVDGADTAALVLAAGAIVANGDPVPHCRGEAAFLRCHAGAAAGVSTANYRARPTTVAPPGQSAGSGSAWACLPASSKSARDPITKKVARRRCSSRLSSTAGVQTGSGPSSNVNAHRRAPIVVLLTAARRHPTRASHSSSERAFGSGARAHRPGVQRVGLSLGRAASRADPRAPGVRSLDAARDLYDHGRIRPYLGCLRERPQGLSWVCSQLGDGGSASDHHRRAWAPRLAAGPDIDAV